MILRHIKDFTNPKIFAAAIFAMAIFTITIFALSVSSFAAENAPATKDAPAEKKAKKMEHEASLPGELCVTCHMEMEGYESDTPKINTDHEVCNRCHKKDGTTTEGHCGCEDADDPMDCEQCHTTPAMGDNPSAEDMNNLCLKCH